MKKYKKIIESSKLGDCYEAGGKYFMDNSLFKEKSKLVLVHGLVTGQGELEGIKYGHCWVEDGEVVIDKSNGRDIKIPKVVYYALGRINKKDIYKYTKEQFRDNIQKYGHWGPWEDSLWK